MIGKKSLAALHHVNHGNQANQGSDNGIAGKQRHRDSKKEKASGQQESGGNLGADLGTSDDYESEGPGCPRSIV